MPLVNDGDTIRGLGFVALYAAYLEELVDELLFLLVPLEPYPDKEKRWQIGRKIDKVTRLTSQLTFGYREDLLKDLTRLRELFEWRNEIIHGRIYGNFDRPDTLKSGRPNVPDREVQPAELYALANTLDAAGYALLRPRFQISRALEAR